jgi:hypothetical protein
VFGQRLGAGTLRNRTQYERNDDRVVGVTEDVDALDRFATL